MNDSLHTLEKENDQHYFIVEERLQRFVIRHRWSKLGAGQ